MEILQRNSYTIITIMHRFIKTVLIIIFFTNMLNAQNYILPLYPDGQVPNYKDVGEEEEVDTSNIVRIGKVQTPDIRVYLPAKRNATGEAVIICPGGGYWILAYDWEGTDIASFWNSKGIAAIVLKYRLPTSKSQIDPKESPLMDAKRAMRIVRYNAKEWNIDPNKIGIMGFSAGGHLASTLSTHFDKGNAGATDPIERISSRPDFSILVYPVISFDDKFGHSGSEKALIGENASEDLQKFYSNELQVTKETPPAVLIHSADDKGVPFENSIAYYKALQKHKIPSSLHIYPYGGHGYSLAIGKGHLSTWPERCHDFIRYLFDEKEMK